MYGADQIPVIKMRNGFNYICF